MNTVKKGIEGIGYVILACVLVDVVVVMFTILQVAECGHVEHIYFWDQQVRLLVGIMK